MSWVQSESGLEAQKVTMQIKEVSPSLLFQTLTCYGDRKNGKLESFYRLGHNYS